MMNLIIRQAFGIVQEESSFGMKGKQTNFSLPKMISAVSKQVAIVLRPIAQE